MPRFFFTTNAGQHLVDREGCELHDPDEARLFSVKLAGAILNDQPFLLSDTRELRVEVRDEDGVFISLVSVCATSKRPRPRPFRKRLGPVI